MSGSEEALNELSADDLRRLMVDLNELSVSDIREMLEVGVVRTMPGSRWDDSLIMFGPQLFDMGVYTRAGRLSGLNELRERSVAAKDWTTLAACLGASGGNPESWKAVLAKLEE